jgi:hypothetical protein
MKGVVGEESASTRVFSLFFCAFSLSQQSGFFPVALLSFVESKLKKKRKTQKKKKTKKIKDKGIIYLYRARLSAGLIQPANRKDLRGTHP